MIATEWLGTAGEEGIDGTAENYDTEIILPAMKRK